MILFFTLSILLLIYVRNDKKAFSFILIAYLLGIIVYVFKLTEFTFGTIEYLISDEAGYFYQKNYSFQLTKSDRLIWYAINYFENHYDIAGIIGIKFINIPITIMGLIWLGKIFEGKIRYINFIIYIPYLLILMTMNLRDMLIITAAIGFVYYLQYPRLRNLMYMLFLLIVVFFLRPVMAFIIILITVVVLFFLQKGKKNVLSKRKLYRIIFILILLSASYFLLQTKINNTIVRYIVYVEYNFYNKKKYNERVKQKDVEKLASSNNLIVNAFYGSLRYIGAPIPTSLLLRILKGGGKFGITDDIIRMINQLFYYCFLIYISINLRTFKKIIKYLSIPQIIILLWLLSYLFVYSFLAFGGTHQRTKIPFQLFIYLIFALIVHFKKYENYSFRKNKSHI